MFFCIDSASTGFLQIFFLPAFCRESSPPRKALAGRRRFPTLYGSSVLGSTRHWFFFFSAGYTDLSAFNRCLPFLYPPIGARRWDPSFPAIPRLASAHIGSNRQCTYGSCLRHPRTRSGLGSAHAGRDVFETVWSVRPLPLPYFRSLCTSTCVPGCTKPALIPRRYPQETAASPAGSSRAIPSSRPGVLRRPVCPAEQSPCRPAK